MAIKKWDLISKKDASPNKWFPIEVRTYQLPNGEIVDDFTISTLNDVAMIVAVTPDEKIVFVKQFKPGYGDVILEFPAGRMESEHKDIAETAKLELEQETGIKVDNLEYLGFFAGFVTKATEKVHCYFVDNAPFNSQQDLDKNEEIEVVTYSFQEVENLLKNNQVNAAITIAAWDLAKRKYGHKFETWK